MLSPHKAHHSSLLRQPLLPLKEYWPFKAVLAVCLQTGTIATSLHVVHAVHPMIGSCSNRDWRFVFLSLAPKHKAFLGYPGQHTITVR